MATTLEKDAASLAGFKAILKGKGTEIAKNVKTVTDRAIEKAAPVVGKTLEKTIKAKETAMYAGIKLHDKVDSIMNKVNPGAAGRILQAGHNPMLGATEFQILTELAGGAIHHGKNLVNKMISK